MIRPKAHKPFTPSEAAEVAYWASVPLADDESVPEDARFDAVTDPAVIDALAGV